MLRAGDAILKGKSLKRVDAEVPSDASSEEVGLLAEGEILDKIDQHFGRRSCGGHGYSWSGNSALLVQGSAGLSIARRDVITAEVTSAF